MPVPPAAAQLFGPQLDRASRYADLLAGAGVQRGLIGPREIDRVWDRHLANCAVLTELLPDRARVVDVGSGAGLPGLPMAIRRPDLRVDLVESLQRRTDFLAEAVAGLGLVDQVRVFRGRAEDAAVRAAVGDAEWVTARAVAPLDRLVRWCLPLLARGGTLLAIKGERARAEADEFRDEVARHGGSEPEVVTCGVGVVDPPTTVVVIRKTGSSRRRAAG
jgi:16S rRNA (guanine527-N7)-methyltransferase